MDSKYTTNDNEQKSLTERFLLVLGIVFFLIYFVLGLIIIFWEKFPIAMEQNYRTAFGLLLIIYSFFRFVRLVQKK